MNDEKYIFFQDVKEKKVTGYSARKQRSHCGKGGRVKLPSDYLTKKELKNMSGECKSYRMNSPMKWHEFKSMPRDLQIAYIKAIKEKYNPSIDAIAKMMGADRANLSRYLLSLGFEKRERGQHPWDKEGFAEWCFGLQKTEESQSVQEEVKDERPADYIEYTHYEAPAEEDEQEVAEEVAPVEKEGRRAKISSPNLKIKFVDAAKESAPAFAIPASGSMNYEGDALDILRSITILLGGAKVAMSVSWDVVEE